MCAQRHSVVVPGSDENHVKDIRISDHASNADAANYENPAFSDAEENTADPSTDQQKIDDKSPDPSLDQQIDAKTLDPSLDQQKIDTVPSKPPTSTECFGENWPSQDQLENSSQTEKKRKVRRYYQRQLDMMKSFHQDIKFVENFTRDEDMVKRQNSHDSLSRKDDLLTKASLIINIFLFIAKIAAASLSESLVVLGSVIDSAMDITVSVMIFLTNRAIRKRNLYKYPRGRSRLEPIALIIVSVIMGACSVQVISKSLDDVANGEVDLSLDAATIAIMAGTIGIKFVLLVVCCMFKSPNALVLAQDHRNDCLSNGVALICVFLASNYWLYLDPIGAIAVSIYILISWLRTGHEHVKQLSGRAAKPEFINRIVKMCLDHRPEFKQIDTVYAYHYGTKFLVEVDVVLDENLSLKEAHDIAEPLQRKIEHLPDVERAFVHIDYETEHRPDYEHKVV